MKRAVIDLGSNTVRVSVYEITEERFQQIVTKKEVAGLLGYTDQGILSDDGVMRVTEAIKECKEISDAVGAASLHCFATAGVRSIQNAGELLDRVYEETGVQIQVISGEDESRLDFLGALHPEGITDGLVVDMGGGSTEIVGYQNKEMHHAISLPFGSLSLYKRFISEIMPSKKECEAMGAWVEKRLSLVDWLPNSAEHMTLVGGTARAIARLHREKYGRKESLHGYTFDPADILAMLADAKVNKKAFLRGLLKTSPERIHTALPGLLTFSYLIALCGCKSVSISRTGVREGYLKEYVLKPQTIQLS